MKRDITIYDQEYREWIASLNQRYRLSQLKASIRVNSEMLQFYWSLGKDIVDMHAEERWGEKVITSLSRDLKLAIPDATGFSRVNLYYMKWFYLMYKDCVSIVPQPEEQLAERKMIDLQNAGKLSIQDENINQHIASDILSLPWGHHKLLIDKFYKSHEIDKALFYMQKALQDGWSRSVLQNFIDTNLYERQGSSTTNFALTLPDPQSDLAKETMRDPYCFDFTKLREPYNERLLKDALLKNIEKFLLELGTGFAYMGREYRLQVGKTEQFADMLFYNVNLRCYVVIEVKTVELTSSHVGQLGGYVVAVDHLLRREGDNKTIGLLICKTKDRVLAQYALEGSSQPLAVSEYELEKFYPEQIEGIIPSVAEIEKHLEEATKRDL